MRCEIVRYGRLRAEAVSLRTLKSRTTMSERVRCGMMHSCIINDHDDPGTHGWRLNHQYTSALYSSHSQCTKRVSSSIPYYNDIPTNFFLSQASIGTLVLFVYSVVWMRSDHRSE